MLHHHAHFFFPSEKVTQSLHEVMRDTVLQVENVKTEELLSVHSKCTDISLHFKCTVSHSAAVISASSMKKKKKDKKITLNMSHAFVTFTAEEILELPSVKYTIHLSNLKCDWDDEIIILFHIKGVSVSVHFLNQVFKQNDSKTWTIYKQHYSNWKVRC